MIENYLILSAQGHNPTNLTSNSALDFQSHENSRQLFKVGTSVTLTQRAAKVQTTPFPRNSSIIISISKHLHSVTKAAAIDHATRKHLIDLR